MKRLKQAAKMAILFLAVLFVCQPVQAIEKEASAVDHATRIKRLAALYKMNVSGEAYIHYCDKGKTVPRTAFYLSNASAVKRALIKEVEIVFEGLNTKQSKMGVEKRRERVMSAAFYHFERRGCANSKAQAARAHIIKMGKLKASTFSKYLETIEKR